MAGRFVPDKAEMHRLQYEWDGLVGRSMIKREQIVELGAKAMVGVQTTRLREGIHHERSVDREGLETKIGANVRHAMIHHRGTVPHVIHAKGEALRFRRGSRIVYASSVMHPGTSPNPYLTSWLRKVV